MKFAKHLRETLHQEWADAYVDYKYLKKVLNELDGPHFAARFCDHLEAQISKVAAFMQAQQDAIASEMPSSSSSVGVNTMKHGLVALGRESDEDDSQGRCESLVLSLERFKSYTALNQEALRKIVKKFDKRFSLEFAKELPFEPPRMPYSAGEIQAWLLVPAYRCLTCIRSAQAPDVERPMHQFNFWVTELSMGCDLLRLRFDLSDPDNLCGDTLLRLQQFSEPESADATLVVKNTFIGLGTASCSRREYGSSQRRKSLPPNWVFFREDTPIEEAVSQTSDDREYFSSPTGSSIGDENQEYQDLGAWGSMPMVVLEHMMCHSLQLAPPPRTFEPNAWGSDDQGLTWTAGHWNDRSLLTTSRSSNQWGIDDSAGCSNDPQQSTNQCDGHALAGYPEEMLVADAQKHSWGDATPAQLVDDTNASSSSSPPSEGIKGRRDLKQKDAVDSSDTGNKDGPMRSRGSSRLSGSSVASSSKHNAAAADVISEKNPRRQKALQPGRQSQVELRESTAVQEHALSSTSSKASHGPADPQEGSAMHRWWTQQSDECPISGFPVALLPYPPFKFRVNSDTAYTYVLIDPLYFVLDILASWRFEACGRALTVRDIAALDAHIRRCKLGRWRLGEAFELFASGKHDGTDSLEDVRSKARRKLEQIRKIQQNRRKRLTT